MTKRTAVPNETETEDRFDGGCPADVCDVPDSAARAAATANECACESIETQAGRDPAHLAAAFKREIEAKKRIRAASTQLTWLRDSLNSGKTFTPEQLVERLELALMTLAST